jgi:hypothetical protein
VAMSHQPPHDVRPDEAGSSQDEHPHGTIVPRVVCPPAHVAQALVPAVSKTRLDTLSGCDAVSNQERPHEWGRGRQECLRHGLPHRRQ